MTTSPAPSLRPVGTIFTVTLHHVNGPTVRFTWQIVVHRRDRYLGWQECYRKLGEETL